MVDRNTFIKLFCFVLSVIGLIFHSMELFGQYLSGKTVVNLMIGRRYEETIPGITICYPIALSMKRTAQLNDRTMKYYDEYDKLIKKLEENFTRNNLEDLAITLQVLQSDTNKELEKWQYGSMLDYFDKYTVDHSQVKLIEEDKIYEGNWTEDDKSYPIKPIESFVLFDKQQSKCFSYFNILQKHWRRFLTSFTTLTITIDHGVPFHSLAITDTLFFSIHSPNILPDLIVPGENFVELKFGYDYDMGFSYIKIEHLEKYDSGCINYDPDYKHANNNIRSDCLLNCMRNLTKCKKGSEPPESLLRREYFEKNLDQKPKVCKIRPNTLLNKYHKQCNMKCPIECRFTYYTLDINYDQRQENLDVERYTKASIRLKHNQLPDYIVKHVPETTFITFISNFGGILSLWLGFSIMSLTQDIVRLTSNLIISKCSINFNTKNTKNIFNINNPSLSFSKNEEALFTRTIQSSPIYRSPHRTIVRIYKH